MSDTLADVEKLKEELDIFLVLKELIVFYFKKGRRRRKKKIKRKHISNP